MVVPLPRSVPSAQGVDAAAVLALVDALDAAEPEVHSLVVVRGGHVVAEGWWAPHTPDTARLLYSLSKSFTSTALGIAVAEGLLGLDDTVISHFPELDDEVTDPRSRAITVRHLASMASGHTGETWEQAARDREDPVRGFLRIPPDRDPGTVFAYNQPCTYTIGAILQRLTGRSLTDYLRPRLLDPLGIGEVGWQAWPPDGPQLGFSGLFARTEDVAKLGLLYLQGGRWGDSQLVPADHVRAATSRQIDTPGQGSVDWECGYGYQFWQSRHGYRGDGAFGQFCVVLPEHDTVVAITSGTTAMQEVLDAVWTHLLPGLDASPAAPDVERRLAERLAGLELAPVSAPATTSPPAWQGEVRLPVDPSSDDATRTPFTAVGVRSTEELVEVTLHEDDDALAVPVGAGRWLTTAATDSRGHPVHVAACGGWQPDGSLRAEVVFLETPHRVDLVCFPGTGSATAAWRGGAPLSGAGFETLHRPVDQGS